MDDRTSYREKTNPGENKKREPSEKKPCLVMIEGDFLGEIYPLEKQANVVGRSDDADIVISDSSVSRRHATISRQGNDFLIADLKSTNGTEVNGAPITAEVRLKDGDKLRFGSIGFKFCYQDQIDTEFHRQLRNMAIKDGLTRVYNKRYFLEMLDKEFNYAKRHNNDLSLIIFDIDHFKQVNDTMGHPAGDYVLKRLSSIVEGGVRDYDLFARYGGEEFVFLLRSATLGQAVAVAERNRKMIETGKFEYEETDMKITISMGVTTFKARPNWDNAMAMVEEADKWLYESKRGGRNRVSFDKSIVSK